MIIIEKELGLQARSQLRKKMITMLMIACYTIKIVCKKFNVDST